MIANIILMTKTKIPFRYHFCAWNVFLLFLAQRVQPTNQPKGRL